MRLTLAVPDLLALDRGAFAFAPALATLAHYANKPDTRCGTLDAFLLARTPEAEPIGAAPFAALGAGLDPGESYALRADPVSLVAGRNDVALATRIDDLSADEAGSLITTLNAHFGRDGLSFHAPRPDAWFILTDATPDVTTTPLAVVRGAIYRWLPVGADAARWRRWLSEMQMLLHEHAANAAREARGRVPVTGIWISDGGRLGRTPPGSDSEMFATPGAGGDVARGLARAAGSTAGATPASFSALPPRTSAVVVVERVNSARVAQLQLNWIGPAVAALARGDLESLSLLADGNGIAVAWHASRPGWRMRTSAKYATRPFMPPQREEDDA
jgi:hypothetical protein